MADQKDERPSNSTEASDLADRLVPDPSDPDVRRLTGFLLGKSNRDGYWRLYLTVDLNHYLEFRQEDTLHAEEFRPTRTVVWLRSDARVHETKTRSAPVDFLQGDIRRGFLRGVSGAPQMLLNAAECPMSGCGHCTASCSHLPGGDTIGYTCGC